MKKALLTAAIAATLLGPAALAAIPASAEPAVVAQTSVSSGDQVSPLLGTMEMLHKQMAAMKMSGDTDKDYMATMKMLVGAMKMASQAEMKSGKNAKTQETATDVYNRLFKSDALDGIYGINR